jgi:hypothetical protein
MKQTYLIFALMINLSIYGIQAQQHKSGSAKSSLNPAEANGYITKLFRGFKLEKFPSKYVAHPVRTDITKRFGRIIEVSEINSLGNPEGLYMAMQANNFNVPYEIHYTVNGKVVYHADFFANSTVIQEITNKNLKEEYEGWQIKREINDDNPNSYFEYSCFIKDKVMTIINGKKVLPEDIQLQKSSRVTPSDVLEPKYGKVPLVIERYDWEMPQQQKSEEKKNVEYNPTNGKISF